MFTTFKNHKMATPIAHYPLTPIKVIIVGAGFGGLTTAIECLLKGHKPIILEKTVEWKLLGDILSLGMYLGRLPRLLFCVVTTADWE